MNLTLADYRTHTERMCGHINVGYGSDVSIRELAFKIAETVGFKGKIDFDLTKPDGMPRKLMDSSLINSLGWSPLVNLKDGLHRTYDDFVKNNTSLRLS